MSRDQVELLLALLALGAAVLTLGIVGVAVAAARSPRWSERLAAFRATDGTTVLLAAAIVAIVATLGSLYQSEIADFPPCRMCWYQRIAEYPLGPILLLAWWRRDHGIRPYVWLLCGAGAAISSYHMLIERFPNLESAACEIDNPCSIKWVEELGFMTIPTMALITFATVAALTWLAGPPDPAHEQPAHGRPAHEPTTREEVPT